MKILIVGSGAREHALAWALAASPLVDKIYCAPGNAGIAEVAERVTIGVLEIDRLVEFAKEKRIDFAITGPEAPLIAGLADRFEMEGIKALGPNAAGAKLEASKSFVRQLCIKHGIPIPDHRNFVNNADALSYAAKLTHPIVVRSEDASQGKGVIISEAPSHSRQAITAMFGHAPGDTAYKVEIEEFLEGKEVNYFALSDGTHVLPLAGAKPYMRLNDNDTGPNTGGMGAYSPVVFLTQAVVDETMSRILVPIINAMRALGTPYQGVLCARLKITKDGPKLMEYNCRFSDPECEVLMMRLRSDLLPALIAVRDGVLHAVDLRWSDEAAVAVVLAAEDYPGPCKMGDEIHGLDNASETSHAKAFHGGTERHDKRLVVAGGRVIVATGMGGDVQIARALAVGTLH